VNSKLGVKYPSVPQKATYMFDYCNDVWKETFPQNKSIAKQKLDKRKERARLAKELEDTMKEMTPEQLDAYMESIPEWKRGALVVQDGQ
jgi:hypothetical protein